MRNLIMALTLTLITLSAANAASTWRCSGGLVSRGNTQSEVVDRCGQPADRNSLGWKRVAKGYMSHYFDDEPVEEWIYPVSDTLFYVLKFEGGRLVDVKSHYGQ